MTVGQTQDSYSDHSTRPPMRLAIVFDVESNPSKWTYKLRFLQRYESGGMLEQTLFPTNGKFGPRTSKLSILQVFS